MVNRRDRQVVSMIERRNRQVAVFQMGRLPKNRVLIRFMNS